MVSHGPSTRRGLTLYEVLLALAIALGSMAVLSQHLFVGTSAAVTSNLRSEAARLADTKLNEVVAGVQTPNTGTFESTVEGTWTWLLTSQSGTPHVDTITLEIVVERTDENGADPLRFTLRRVVRDPALFDSTLATDAVVVEGGVMKNVGRPGYTLLEVILALALTSVLVGSMLSALYLYERLSTAGQHDVQRARLVRAVVDLVDDDLRAVVYRPVEEEVDEDEESVGAAEEETEETTVVEVTDPNEAYESGSVGLVGDAWTLVVHTNRPNRETAGDVAFTDLVADGGRTSDLRSVSYFLAVPGAPGLQGAVAERLLATTVDPLDVVDGEPLGLVRLEGDRLAMTLADQTGDYATLATGARLIAPEVKSLTFQYHDGTLWRQDWDSVAFERLPRAVEMSFGLRIVDETEAENDDDRSRGTADQPRLVDVRHVFALPQADPTPLEEVLP